MNELTDLELLAKLAKETLEQYLELIRNYGPDYNDVDQYTD